MNSKKVESVKKEFGRTVLSIRLSKGLSLRAVSENSGLDNSKVSKIEKGLVNITLSTLIILAEGLGVTPSDLLKGAFN